MGQLIAHALISECHSTIKILIHKDVNNKYSYTLANELNHGLLIGKKKKDYKEN